MSSNNNKPSTEPFWKLTNGKNGEKYLIFPTNRRRNNNIASLNNESASLGISGGSSALNQKTEIKTYKLRWFILTVICLINMSNAINWICYSAISNYTALFYNVNYSKVNYLSLIYLIITVPAGFVSFVVIDYFGIRSSLNLAGWLNFVGSFLRVLSSIDQADGVSLIPLDYKYLVLMSGQVLCSLAQPFVMFVTTKFANSWFTENQRALANTVALSSNTFGVLIGAFISPLVVNSDTEYIHQMSILNFIACGSSLIPAILAAFITRSTPPTPPSYSAIQALQRNNNEIDDRNINNTLDDDQPLTFKENFKIYLSQIGKLLKSFYFVLLLLSFGFGLGLFNALTTLLQQILCVRGYTDNDVGIFGGIMILCGIIGSLVAGIIVDKTKRFEEVAKICFCMSCVANIFFTIIQNYDNDEGLIKYLITIAFCMIGIFGLPLLPVCMEMSVECVYPIPEATSTGLLFIAGQLVGIIMIVAYPAVAPVISENSYIYTNIQTCINTNSTSNSTSNSLNVVDYQYPIYGQTGLSAVIAIIFTIFYKCPYLRLRTERERLAEEILNSAPDLSN